jgi:hypothetical protein
MPLFPAPMPQCQEFLGDSLPAGGIHCRGHQVGTMDKIARLNIEHFKRLLERETDETKRKMILRLLAEEEAKLKALLQDKQDKGGD